MHRLPRTVEPGAAPTTDPGRHAEVRAAEAIDAYLRNLTPVSSPHLTDNLKLSEKALAGRKIFEGKAAKAAKYAKNDMFMIFCLSGNRPRFI